MAEKLIDQILQRISEETLEHERIRKLGVMTAVKTSQKIISNNKVTGALRNPFSLFPEEIWAIISLKLLDESDVNNYSLTCPDFQTIVHRSAKYHRFASVLDLIHIHLQNSDILSCRKVCKRWSTEIDKFLERKNVGYRQFEKVITFPLTKTQSESLLSMEKHTRNPFMGGRVRLVAEGHYTQEIRSQIQNILTRFGKHIYNLNCEFDFDDIDEENTAMLGLEIVCKCENLKRLKIYTLSGLSEIPQSSNHSRSLLPDNPKLDYFACWTHDSNAYVRDILFKYQSQFKQLATGEVEECLEMNFKFPQLKLLTVTGESEKLLENLQLLEAPNLEDLVIDTTALTVGIPDLIKTTTHFPKLKNLEFSTFDMSRLVLLEERCMQICDIEKLCSPVVEALVIKLTNLGSCASFDFLIFFPNLERLEIHTGGIIPDDVETVKDHGLVIKFIDSVIRGAEEIQPIYESNVWQKFKRLEQILVNDEAYTREKYESHITPGEN